MMFILNFIVYYQGYWKLFVAKIKRKNASIYHVLRCFPTFSSFVVGKIGKYTHVPQQKRIDEKPAWQTLWHRWSKGASAKVQESTTSTQEFFCLGWEGNYRKEWWKLIMPEGLTPPKANMEPENLFLEKEKHLQICQLLGSHVNF